MHTDVYGTQQCAAGFLPPMAAPMYTSYAPIAAAMPPVAPMAPAVTYGAAMPTAPNVYQYPTVWSGDHVVRHHAMRLPCVLCRRY
jgi:hypothetical protein